MTAHPKPTHGTQQDVHMPEDVVAQASRHNVWLRKVANDTRGWVPLFEFAGSETDLKAFLADAYGYADDEDGKVDDHLYRLEEAE